MKSISDVDYRKRNSTVLYIGIIILAIWISTALLLDDFGYEILPSFYLIVLIPLMILGVWLFFNIQTRDSVSKNMNRGIILLFIGVIGLVIWFFVVMTLKDEGYEILPECFLIIMIPLTLVVLGLCYDVYAIYLMSNVRKRRTTQKQFIYSD